MHRIEPARLKPGVPRGSVEPPAAADSALSSAVIRGKALIFWDLKIPGRKHKLDAIDTDQITPAADCVSESLDTLDERWKAGSFRYLMPDFRERVHRGETFLVAGDRFAIGSSREMSPAGLKGVAEEAGLEMVVVCGGNMGDIFRRNALNLGLHVVQSPEAVADARDGDEFSFEPAARRLTNETRGVTYDPVPLTPKEDEIRRSGGIVAVGRREFQASVRTTPRIEWPDAEQARRMTSTEQIAWAHRVDRHVDAETGRDRAGVRRPAAGLGRHRAVCDPHVQSDHRRRRDLPAPGGDRQRSLRLHRQAGRRQADGDRARVRAAARHREAVLRDAGRRDLPFLFSRARAGRARAVHSGRRLAQPRVRRVRRGRHGRRIDDARVRLGDRLRLLHASRGRAASCSPAGCSRG